MKRHLYTLFFLALAVRVVFFCIATARSDGSFERVFPRYDGYYEIAENLVQGNGFSRSTEAPVVPDSVRTPLYPLFIAVVIAIFKSYYAVGILQILIGSLIPLFAYRIAVQLLQSERIAFIAGIFLACEPLTVSLATTLQSEMLFTAFFLGGVTLFLDYFPLQNVRVLLSAASLFALATLTRPTIQFIPLLLIMLILFLSRENLRRGVLHALLVASVFLAVLAPWSIRNFVRFGSFALNVQSVSVPYGYLVPSVLAFEQNADFRETQKAFFATEGIKDGVDDITLANAAEYKKRIAPILLSHPSGLFQSVVTTFYAFFTHDGYLDVLARWNYAPASKHPALTELLSSPQKFFVYLTPLITSSALLVVLGRIFWIAVTILFVYGIVRYFKIPEYRPRGAFVLLLVLYFTLTTIAVGLAVNARFRMPVNALILPFAMYGAYAAASRIGSRGRISPPSPSVIQVQTGVQKNQNASV